MVPLRPRCSRLAVLLLLVLGGCDRSKLPYFGQLGESCYPNQTCAPGLACVAGRCGPRRDDAGADAPRVDQGGDAPTSCEPPGSPCVSADPCAVQARCAPDGSCQVFERRDCDDGLDCTVDGCTGQGLCEHVPQAGWCALEVFEGGKQTTRCFADGALRPDNACLRCAAEEPRSWSVVATGASCDDGEACTRDDRCSQGTCVGTPMQCDDGLACTTNACDGQGGCLPPVVAAGSCAIDGACYATSSLHTLPSGGCGACLPAQSQTAWTPQSAACEIEGQCYRDGDKHPAGCASCDSQASGTGWTIQAGSCLIDKQCFKSGDKGPDSCSSCTPLSSPTQWTPDANTCRIDGACLPDQTADASGCLRCDVAQNASTWSGVGATQVQRESFDAAAAWPAGWTETHSDASGQVRWQVLSGGTQQVDAPRSLYYGNPVIGSYDSGALTNAGVARWSGIALAAGKAGLRFHVWMDVENGDKYDTLQLWIAPASGPASQVWSKPAGQSWLRKWLAVDVDLSSHAGQSDLRLELRFDSVDHLNNTGAGVYVDALTLYSGC